MDGLFQVIPYLFFGMFFLTFGLVIFTVIKSVGQWNKNNRSPRLTVNCNSIIVCHFFNLEHIQHVPNRLNI